MKLLVLLILAVQVFCKDDENNSAPEFNLESFNDAVRDQHVFLMFYVPWCDNCKKLLPVWEEFAEKTNARNIPNLQIGKVDCTTSKDLCTKYDVTDYPKCLLFHLNKSDYVMYKASRNVESITEFLDEQLSLEDDASEPEKPKAPREILELTNETYAKHLSEGKHFVKFYAPWCGHCQRLAPIWLELDELLKDTPEIKISQVDCTLYRSICQDFDVKGYPTLLWIENGKKIEKYSGMRNAEDLMKYAQRKAATFHFEYPSSAEDMEKPSETSEVTELTSNNFKTNIEKGTSFIKFYAPWCGHCKNLAPIWLELAKTSSSKNVKIAKVDCTVQKQICNEEEIEGYPTLFIYKDGKKIKEYVGSRNLKDLNQFLTALVGHDEL